MKFAVTREALLKPLSFVAGVVERRQTLPILSHVLLVLDGKQLSLVGTDLEVELKGQLQLGVAGQSGAITVPARKLVDICKSLPDGSNIEVSVAGDDHKVILRSGRSRFALTTLPASDFPNIEESGTDTLEISVPQGQLKRLIDRTAFAMAQQDVRYYLNGILLELDSNYVRIVATDGHRLAMSTLSGEFNIASQSQAILPRKGVMELSRLLQDTEESITLVIGSNHFHAKTTEFTFTSKLVDGKFPDYDRVLPQGAMKQIYGSRMDLKQALIRSAILSNEKYRGVRLILSDGLLQILANNPEQEEAEEMVSIDYQGDRFEIGFNVSYLIDVLGVLRGEQVKISLSDSNSSALLEEQEGHGDSLYVVMPMRL